MFSNVEAVCANARSYAVVDAVVRDHVLRSVAKASRCSVTIPAIDRDLHDAQSRSNCSFAVNLKGQQCSIFLTRISGVGMSFLVNSRDQTVAVVPLRFAGYLYDGTVARCTLLHRQRVMVVDAVLAPTKLSVDQFLSAHDPDPMLFPARLTKRRSVSRSELARMFDAGCLPGRCHSVSLFRDFGPEAVFRAEQKRGR